MISLILTGYAPFISITIITIYLTVVSVFNKRIIDKIFYLILILNFSIIHSSRAVLKASNDDFSFYYTIYNSDLSAYLELWRDSPIEPLILGLISIIKIIYDGFSPNGLIFIFTFMISLIFLLAINNFLKNTLSNKIKTFSILVALISFNYFYSSQLVRQQFAMVTILFALSSINVKDRSVIYSWILGFLFHFTIIFYFLLAYLARLKFKKFIIASIFSTLFFIFTLLLVLNTELLHFFNEFSLIRYKLNYYSATYNLTNIINHQFNLIQKHDLGFLLSYTVLLFFMIFLNYKNLNSFYSKFFIGIYILYILFLPFNLLGFRISLITMSILIGFYKVLIYRKVSILYRIIMMYKTYLFIVFHTYTYKFVEDNGFNLYSVYPSQSKEWMFYLKYWIN